MQKLKVNNTFPLHRFCKPPLGDGKRTYVMLAIGIVVGVLVVVLLVLVLMRRWDG